MRTPFEVVGRRAELAKLTGFIEGPERPTAVAIVGAAGVGKTTLWTARVCTARDRGWTVLSGRPSGAEASLSFAGLSDLVAAVDDEVVAGIPAVQRKALEVALHPLLAAAVHEPAPPSRRRSVHRLLAGRLEGPEERARHLALGSEGPDLEIAGHLDEAAKLAQARGSPAAAAELVELALQLTPPVAGPGRSERMLTGAAGLTRPVPLTICERLLTRWRGGTGGPELSRTTSLAVGPLGLPVPGFPAAQTALLPVTTGAVNRPGSL